MTRDAPDLERDPGSFRDRSNCVYQAGAAVYRGVDGAALEQFQQLSRTALFRRLIDERKLIGTTVETGPAAAQAPWAGLLKHERVPVISYPYEWCFGQLKDAALLQLELVERAIPAGWTHKDASAYNVQWRGAEPVFIDIPSFQPYAQGEPWVGYRQFCMMYLYPLMLRAYKGIPFQALLRSSLEGIEPALASRILSGFSRFRRGVPGHVYLHAKMQESHRRAGLREARSLTETSGKVPQSGKRSRHSMAMVLGTLQSLRNLIRKMAIDRGATVWGDYDTGHSYARESFETKQAFVAKHASSRRRKLVWDLGCNTGTFSRICSAHSDYVVAADGDEAAVERLYQELKGSEVQNVLPLVLDVSNVSPNQGWRGQERKAFDAREKPELVLCLALVHHIVITANIPLHEFVAWLRALGAEVILEFVGLDDDMVKLMLRNRVHQYDELSQPRFEQTVQEAFDIVDSVSLKGGHRKLYYLKPR